MVERTTHAPGTFANSAAIVSLVLFAAALLQIDKSQRAWQSLPLARFGSSLPPSDIAHGLVLEWHSTKSGNSYFARTLWGYCYIENYSIDPLNERIVSDYW